MSTANGSTTSSPPRKSRIGRLGRRAGIALAVIVALVLGITQVVRMATAGPEKVVHHFLAAVASGDYATAYGDFSAPLKEEQPLDAFTAVARQNATLLRVKETTFNNRSIDNDGAELAGSVTLESGTRVPASFRLVEESGQWKLLGYHIGS